MSLINPAEFISWENLRYKDKCSLYRVMVFEPRGHYPATTLTVPNGFFHADKHIAFSVVQGESWETLNPDMPYSEFDWASPQELRLLASMMLCERRDEACIRLYPLVRYPLFLEPEDRSLAETSTMNAVRDAILKRVANTDTMPRRERLNSLAGKPYDLIATESFSFERLEEFWSAIATTNFTLLRGIYALIKADMLSSHYEFSEEAIISSYIALDASYTLVRRKLQGQGNQSPTIHDAAVWLHEHFDRPFGLPKPAATEKYFHEFYEQRVMTLHPSNRYGDFPFAPIMHEDVMFLRRSLREVFGYLLLERHGPDYHDDILAYESRSQG